MAFALKAYTGPTAVKAVAEKLRAIAGLDSVSEGTDHVYFCVEDDTHESARVRAQGMIRFAGVKDVWVKKV